MRGARRATGPQLSPLALKLQQARLRRARCKEFFDKSSDKTPDKSSDEKGAHDGGRIVTTGHAVQRIGE